MIDNTTRTFTVICGNSKHPLYVYPWTTLETAWLGEKFWHIQGSVVTIIDDHGNKKEFVKE